LNYQDFLWFPCQLQKKKGVQIMTNNKTLSILDRPEIINFLFYPRTEAGWDIPEYITQYDMTTLDGVRINARLYLGAPDYPHILFFHGNGEIAEDYNDVGHIFTQFNMNFMVVDYRGYGRSEGYPSVTSMMSDAHEMLKSLMGWLNRNNRNGPLWVMGRSLGSAPAIELAASYSEKIKGLIVESGFAETIPLLQRLGIDIRHLDLNKNQVFSNSEKIRHFSGPTLIIHAQFDQIIPFHHGEELFANSPAAIKKIHMVSGADHNTILMIAGKGYFELIKDFITNAGAA
jgi:pimeloyl-ACP methyl ester carboxylesterase